LSTNALVPSDLFPEASPLKVRRRAGTLVGNREIFMHPNTTRAAGAPLAAIVMSLFAPLLPSTLQAAEAASESELGQILVTATRQATRSNELLSDVSLIAREEIENAGQTSLEELLARQPGIEFASNGGPGTNSSVFIRGASTKQTIVLIDGLRVGSASSGDVAFSRVPLAQIERIEIVRGPASSLYGSDAIGGVIQLFTRRGDGATRFNASAGTGTYRTTDASVGVAAGNETFSYSLQAAHYQTDGFSALRNPANSAYNPDRDGYRNSSISGSFSFRPAQGHELGLSLLNSAGVSKYDSYPPSSDFRNDQTVSAYSFYSRNKLAEAWTSTLRFGRSSDDSTSRTDGIADSVFYTEQNQVSWQNDLKLPVGQALLAAEHLQQRLMSSTDFQANERSIDSLLAGWNGNLGDHRLQGNLRHDENSQFGGKTTGGVGYGYQFSPDWRGRLSYGTAFRAPSFNELYFPSTFGATYAGNPNLKPEWARNREIGLDWEIAAHRFSAVYFNNKVTDLIVGYPLQNVNSATLAGTSLSYAGHRGRWNGGVTLDLQRPRDDSTGKRLLRRADEQLKAHLGYTQGPLKVTGEWQLVGERFENAANTQRLGGYGLVNLAADYRLEKSWTLFARANNLFNKRYELAKDYATAGASVFVGLRYSPQ
jgi:vitamin B12 transporter